MIDDIDRKILRLLQDNARISNAEISRHVGLAPSVVFKRIRRLEKDEVITAYETRVNRHKVGLGMSSFVLVMTGEKPGSVEIGKRIASLPEVQDVYFTAGDFYYFVKVKTRDAEDHNEFIKKLGNLGVKDCRTTLILNTIKESLKLNI
ncbi:MAG: Lrp/AsnC family transcriptional regulator [Victivallaceae bacterium]